MERLAISCVALYLAVMFAALVISFRMGIFTLGDRHLPHAPRKGYDEDGILADLTLVLLFSMGGSAMRAPDTSPRRTEWTFST